MYQNISLAIEKCWAKCGEWAISRASGISQECSESSLNLQVFSLLWYRYTVNLLRGRDKNLSITLVLLLREGRKQSDWI
jgi:hypothetical protein